MRRPATTRRASSSYLVFPRFHPGVPPFDPYEWGWDGVSDGQAHLEEQGLRAARRRFAKEHGGAKWYDLQLDIEMSGRSESAREVILGRHPDLLDPMAP